MSKQLAIIVILVVSAFAVASGQQNDNSTAVAPQDDSSDNSSGGLISSVLGLPFKILSALLSPITGLLDLILTTVGHLVGNILNLVTDIVSWILTPVSGVIGLPLAIVRFILNALTDGSGDVLNLVIRVLSIIVSNVSGLVLGGSTASAIPASDRTRRDLMDSIMGTMIRSIFYLPYRFIRNVLDAFVVPLDFVYAFVTWPLQYVFGDNESGSLTYSHAIATRSVYTDITSIATSIISSFLLNISESTQAALYETLQWAWELMKQVLLPNLDSFIVSMMGSSWVPANIVNWLSTIHTAYTWLHLFGII